MDKLLDELRAVLPELEACITTVINPEHPPTEVSSRIDPKVGEALRDALARIESDARELERLRGALGRSIEMTRTAQAAEKQQRESDAARLGAIREEIAAWRQWWAFAKDHANHETRHAAEYLARIESRATPGAQGAGQPQRPEGEEVSE